LFIIAWKKFAIADVYGDIEGRRAFISLPPKVPLRSRALRFHRGMLGDGLGALEPFSAFSHNDIDKSAWLSPS
jgi:hypothetical protein